MRTLSRTLQLLGAVVFAVAALHTLLGAQADVLLGAQVSAQTLWDPTADSQNRFFGASFLLYAMLLFVCANDLRRHQSLLGYVLLATFLGGCARLLSIWLRGTPSGLAWALLAIELIVPPVFWWWVKKWQQWNRDRLKSKSANRIDQAGDSRRRPASPPNQALLRWR